MRSDQLFEGLVLFRLLCFLEHFGLAFNQVSLSLVISHLTMVGLFLTGLTFDITDLWFYQFSMKLDLFYIFCYHSFYIFNSICIFESILGILKISGHRRDIGDHDRATVATKRVFQESSEL